MICYRDLQVLCLASIETTTSTPCNLPSQLPIILACTLRSDCYIRVY